MKTKLTSEELIAINFPKQRKKREIWIEGKKVTPPKFFKELKKCSYEDGDLQLIIEYQDGTTKRF